MIKLVKVDKENFHDVINLKVSENQINFIESNEDSIAESKCYKFWNPKCIYEDDILIGFCMYGQIEFEDNRVWLDRFMIDEKYQGNGFGKKAFKHILDEIKKEYNCGQIYLSIFEENERSLKLYKENSFKFNGEVDYGGELVMVKRII
ncbi:MAG: GNAT family N-acetyltransferase [Sarcina sp.]